MQNNYTTRSMPEVTLAPFQNAIYDRSTVHAIWDCGYHLKQSTLAVQRDGNALRSQPPFLTLIKRWLFMNRKAW
ncbi:hypothetical protein A3197_02580 [Candidatus Thiodiazotropha endoloripes]|nr:hypothetical protein A3197_02580 [Candidatus Thiodiazotropha endoloripes]